MGKSNRLCAKLEAARDLPRQGKRLQGVAETLSMIMSSVTRSLGPRTAKPVQERS